MITLIKNRVAIRIIGDPPKIGSIYIPDAYKERAEQGIVKYVGPECIDLKVGDYVVFSGYEGTTLIIEGEPTLVVIPEDRHVCKINPPATEIAGLYHKGADGTFFPATYESSVEMIRDQYFNLPRFANLKDRKFQG